MNLPIFLAALLCSVISLPSAAGEKLIDFQGALKLAKKEYVGKKDYETYADFVARTKKECEKESNSPVCGVVYFERGIGFQYSPEAEAAFTLDLIPETASVDYGFPVSGEREMRGFCLITKETSSVVRSYKAQNAFGAKAIVYETNEKAEGIVFLKTINIPSGWVNEPYPKTPKFYKACYDNRKFFDRSIDGPSNQRINIPKSDFKNENGKFLIRVMAIPVAPYYSKISSSTTATFDDPFSKRSVADVLVVNPISFEIIGGVTKKVYASFDYESYYSENNEYLYKKIEHKSDFSIGGKRVK